MSAAPVPLWQLGEPTGHACFLIARKVWPEKVPERANDNIRAAGTYTNIVREVLRGHEKYVSAKELAAIEAASREVLGL